MFGIPSIVTLALGVQAIAVLVALGTTIYSVAFRTFNRITDILVYGSLALNFAMIVVVLVYI